MLPAKWIRQADPFRQFEKLVPYRGRDSFVAAMAVLIKSPKS